MNPDNKVHGANMGPMWGGQDSGGSHIGHMNLAIWEVSQHLMMGTEMIETGLLSIQEGQLLVNNWWAKQYYAYL